MNAKLSRNLWIIAGFGFLISFIFNFKDGNSIGLIVLDILVAIISFYNAYIEHKKITKGNTK